MNTTHILMRNLRLLSAVMIASFFAFTNGSAQSIGQWDFNANNLAATAGATLGDLTYADGAGGATEVADAFGSTTTFGIPSINGTNAIVMRFPAATGAMGYLMPTPAGNGGGNFVNEYTIVFDLLYPSNGVARPLVDIDDNITFKPGPDFIVSATGGIGIPPSGPFHGTLAPNTWNRVGFTVTTTQVRMYINGVEVGSQTHSFEGPQALPPNSSLLILANAVGDAGLGYVNSIQIRDVALTTPQMQALGGASADGIPQTIPAIPSFVQSWTPAGALASSPSDLGVVISPGEASVNMGSIVLKLNSTILTGVQITSNVVITVRTNGHPLTVPNNYTLELSYTDSQVGAKTFSKQFKAALLFEDFEQLALGPSIEEGGAGVHTNVWTKTPPPGWAIDDSGMPNVVANDPTGDGVAEWNGWSFASKTF